MQIQVTIAGWSHACCGPALNVGDLVQWELAQLRLAEGQVQFQQNDHDELHESGVPVRTVSATIVALELLDYDYFPAIGDPHQLIRSEATARRTSVSDIASGTDFDHDSIIVTLLVSDVASLPPVHDWNPEIDIADETETEQQGIARFQMSPLRVQLKTLLTGLTQKYQDVAQIRVDQLGNASFVPSGQGCAEVHWMVDFAQAKPMIIANIAQAEWKFELNEQNIILLGQLTAAVAKGRITDRRRGWRKKSLYMEMAIVLETGQKLSQREKINGFYGRNHFAVSGPLGDRMTRENPNYAPWSSPPFLAT